MPYPAPGAGHLPHHDSPAPSDSNAPRGRDSSSAWQCPPRSPLPADSLAQERTAADHTPHHEWHCRPAASDSNPPPWGDSSSPADPLEAHYLDKLAGYFVEAAGRLPLAEIPYLAGCIRYSGLAVGLADPVTNILLTTIDAFAHTEPCMIYPVDRTAIEETKNKITFGESAHTSLVALNRFLTSFFRYLTEPQAHLLLHMAGYDLRAAIEAVQLHIGGPNYPDLLVPDSARTRTSFVEAAYPPSSAPRLLRLMTSSYRRCMVEPILEDLRQGRKLTAECVYKLCNMLRNPWSPPQSHPPPPTPGTSRDRGGGLTMVVCIGVDFFVTTRISKDSVATTTVTSSRPACADFSEDTTNLLSMFPIHHGRLVSQKDFRSVTLETPDFMPFLKLQLLDMIHGVYLKAIAMLPVRALREGHLLHSLVTAGHCYGPLDPVSNIIINTVWYHTVFPLSEDVTSKVAAADILEARSMHRIESRSIDGLVAYLCRYPSRSEQDAITLLCKNRLDTPILDLSNMCDVALAAKHPQPAAFGEFLERASIRELYELYRRSTVRTDPDSALEVLKMALLQETSRTTCVAAPVRRCAHDMDRSAALEWLNSTPSQKTALETLSAMKSYFMSEQASFRIVLEELLIGYGYIDPLVPLYELGVICGVTRQTNYNYTDVYHANFLASSDGGSSWKLFFAEFWNKQDVRIEESKKPFCCPIPDNHEYPGRCVVCENDLSVIVHPQSHKYYMGNSTLPFPIPGHFGADTREMLDFDLIYSSEKEAGAAV